MRLSKIVITFQGTYGTDLKLPSSPTIVLGVCETFVHFRDLICLVHILCKFPLMDSSVTQRCNSNNAGNNHHMVRYAFASDEMVL